MRTAKEVQEYINLNFGTIPFENYGCRLFEAEAFLVWINQKIENKEEKAK